jgi:CubicO group peptidase (beta-lactamase class C family)
MVAPTFFRWGRWLLAAVIVCAALAACTTAKLIWHNYADFTDYKRFPAHPIDAAPVPFRFQTAGDTQTLGDTIPVTRYAAEPFAPAEQMTLRAFLAEMQTVAFLIIKEDTILLEHYFGGYTEASVLPSFSVAKAFVSALVGIALAEQHLRDVQQPITDFLPELQGKGFDRITIEHLLQMTSGIQFSQRYDTISDAGKLYYTADILQRVRTLKVQDPPGTRFHYKSIDTQLLGIILTRATGTPLARYLEEKIWHPLGMEFAASWSLDHENGLEKAFCCLNARARDFAKYGRLYMHKGTWNGKQIVPAAWVQRSLQVDTTQGSVGEYQYQWWLASETEGDFYALGLHGQYLYVNPQRRMIIVKFSRRSLSRQV